MLLERINLIIYSVAVAHGAEVTSCVVVFA